MDSEKSGGSCGSKAAIGRGINAIPRVALMRAVGRRLVHLFGADDMPVLRVVFVVRLGHQLIVLKSTKWTAFTGRDTRLKKVAR